MQLEYSAALLRIGGYLNQMSRNQNQFMKYLGVFVAFVLLQTSAFDTVSATAWNAPLDHTASGLSMTDSALLDVSGITRVWAVDDGEKIKREDLQHPLADSPENIVWDGGKIHIFGARNEVVAFQLMIEAGMAGARGVDVWISDLTQGAYSISGSASGPSDPYDYRGRGVELFTEHYLHISERSRGGTSWTKSAAPSDYYYGWVPDALIPFSAPSGMGGAPFDIPANMNQGVWVDITIPRDAPAGTMIGEVQVTVGGNLSHRIPLELQIYPFTLTDETHFHNMFAISEIDISLRHGVELDSEEFYEVLARYYQMAHRHRMDLVQAVRNISQVRRFHNRYLTGSLYSQKNGYAGPGEGVGNSTFSIGLYGNLPTEYGSNPQNWSKELWWEGSDAWATWFAENAPHVSIHKFLLPDEPDSAADLRAVKAQADWSHSNTGIGGTIPTFVTHWIEPEYQGYVDFWSISTNHALAGTIPGTDPQAVQDEQEAGRQIGVYNGYRPATGSILIDTDAVDFRVIPWIGWKYNLDQYFYWNTTYWIEWANDSRRWNIFSNPETMQNHGNGEGTFFYPGQDKVYIEEDRGLAGPLASIRMKNWRRGMQDYEYLWLANEMGLGQEVEHIVNQAIPAALWDTNSRSDIAWSEHGYSFEVLRQELAKLIAYGWQEASSLPVYHQQQEFVDIGLDHPYYEEINALTQLGFIGGCNQDPPAFCPDRSLTRAEAAILFGRVAYGSSFTPPIPEQQLFIDMPLMGDDSWATPWAVALWQDGYLSECGRDPLRFCPNAAISRVESLILMLRVRYGLHYTPPSAEGLFSDVSLRWEETKWIEAAYYQGLLGPCKTTVRMRFCPYGTISRGEAAAMITRALNLVTP
ncbi:MAG: hypothetical protein A2Z14_09575 [Chloroflexi bacterium RBG_16_48_8]|nr:MAG: hypothetical protein A2Z14_09575 [Chloroflexi bacterium RBG_16_48_8]